MWMRGTVKGTPLAVAVVYWWTGKGSKEKNKEMAKCLNEDVQEMRNHGDDIILLGDFNAHIEELDGRRDGNGQYTYLT